MRVKLLGGIKHQEFADLPNGTDEWVVPIPSDLGRFLVLEEPPFSPYISAQVYHHEGHEIIINADGVTKYEVFVLEDVVWEMVICDFCDSQIVCLMDKAAPDWYAIDLPPWRPGGQRITLIFCPYCATDRLQKNPPDDYVWKARP